MKRFLSCLMVLALLCTAATFASAADEIPTIKVAYMITMNPAEDRDLVQAEINRVLLEKGLNVQIEFICIDFASWGTQINLLLTDGSVDLFNCSFMSKMSVLVDNGSIAELDSLLDEYGQGIQDTLGEYLECGKIGEHYYGAPKLNAYSSAPCFVMNKNMADAAGINKDDITDLDSLTEALKKVKAAYPDVTALSTGVNGGIYDPNGVDLLGTDKAYACLMLEDGSNDLTVTNFYATDTFLKYLEYGKTWVENGFIRKDAINGQESSFSGMHSEEAFGTFAGYASEEISDSVYSTAFAMPIQTAMLAETPWVTTDNVTGMTWCISELSKNKEASMIFLNALFTDPDIANLCCNGIEGVHYVVTDEGNITFATAEQNSLTTGWPSGMGTFWPNICITYPWAPSTKATYDAWLASNESCSKSPALGFTFDSTNVADEIAACNNVVSKYYNTLMLNIGDTQALLADFLGELEQSGVNDIIAEKQAQLDAWAELNGK